MEKAVIFDLDGTLIDSLPDIVYNLNMAFKKFGFQERSYSEIMGYIGNGARRLVKDGMGETATEEQVDRCLKYYNEIYTNSGSPNTGLFKGVADMLLELKNRGYKLAILTNKPQITTDNVYQTYLKRFGFDLVVGQSQKIKCKPDKSGVEYIIRTLGVLPQNTFFIGDGETDVLTAINAGIKSIAVLWGYRSHAQLSAVGATLFVENASQILTLLD